MQLHIDDRSQCKCNRGCVLWTFMGGVRYEEQIYPTGWYYNLYNRLDWPCMWIRRRKMHHPNYCWFVVSKRQKKSKTVTKCWVPPGGYYKGAHYKSQFWWKECKDGRHTSAQHVKISEATRQPGELRRAFPCLVTQTDSFNFKRRESSRIYRSFVRKVHG